MTWYYGAYDYRWLEARAVLRMAQAHTEDEIRQARAALEAIERELLEEGVPW